MITVFQLVAAYAPCPGGDFFGFPKWYAYLDGVTDSTSHLCSPKLHGINDVWLILAAIIEILLRVAALMAVGYVIYGGITYMLSQGESDKTTQARHTIINAIIGLVIAIMAAVVVAFIAGTVN